MRSSIAACIMAAGVCLIASALAEPARRAPVLYESISSERAPQAVPDAKRPGDRCEAMAARLGAMIARETGGASAVELDEARRAYAQTCRRTRLPPAVRDCLSSATSLEGVAECPARALGREQRAIHRRLVRAVQSGRFGGDASDDAETRAIEAEAMRALEQARGQP